MNALNWSLLYLSATSACLCVAMAALSLFARWSRIKRRNAVAGGLFGKPNGSNRLRSTSWVLGYMERLTRQLYTGASQPLSLGVRFKRASETRAGKQFRGEVALAGCSKDISVSAYMEARVRFACVGLAVGVLVGALFSIELSMMLGLAGAVVGASAPRRALARAKRKRSVEAERCLSEMLEVVVLGLRSGLSFDLSFALYGEHFEGGFATSCARAYRRWSLGLTTREEALRELAASYDCAQLARVVDGVVRSLRLGTALTGTLEEAAEQSRASYRTMLEERVAKAPVKMMLPTGTLILPAMLMLVMGPILLELAGGF